MKIVASALSLGLVLAGSTVAQAQQSNASVLTRPPIRSSTNDAMRRYETDAQRLQQQQDLEAQDPERVDLAREVGALMEAGRCDEARDRARAEGDRQMALRVRQMCRPARPAS
jgi:hypothetical protein